MNELPLHKRVLEWFTSHTLWEMAKIIGTALCAWVLSFGVSRITAPFGTALNIFLVLMGAMGMLWVSGVVRWSTGKTEETKLEIFFFSPGLAVSLTPSIGRVLINLQILSTKATELLFLRVTLRNNKGTYIDCESSEPITIEPMQVIAKIIDKKVPPTDLATFEKGEMVYLEGFAKFRDGNLPLRRVQIITINTVPSM